jgi:hypothetical protein
MAYPRQTLEKRLTKRRNIFGKTVTKSWQAKSLTNVRGQACRAKNASVNIVGGVLGKFGSAAKTADMALADV